MKQRTFSPFKGRGGSRRGFTLLEVIVVITIMVLIAGAVAPMAAQAVSSARNDATRAQVKQLGEASLQFAKDVLRAPRNLTELNNNSGHVPGWNGPYASAGFDAAGPGTTAGGYTNDAFGRQLRVITVSNRSIRIVSAGEDGIRNNQDDISVLIDITPVLRNETFSRIATINSAILQYNASQLPDHPLSTSWDAAYATLVSLQYLPADTRYLYDAVGSKFVPDPAGVSPVTKVKSTAFASVPASGGS